MFRKIFTLTVSLLTLLSLAPGIANGQGKSAISLNGNSIIYTSAKPGEPVFLAVQNLQRDMKKIFGKSPVVKNLMEIDAPGIIVSSADKDKLPKTVAGWEAHHLYIANINKQSHIVLEGTDMRGTIYAIYTFSEKVLGVPPLWYYSDWQPITKESLTVPASFNINCTSPEVKYRAFFPNDTDLFAPWRKLSADNNSVWLETALRLKFNTIEWFDDERDYGNKYGVSPTTRLISNYGLINTTHHHSPLNATLAGWEDYWKKTRDTIPPELSLANVSKLEQFWRYNVECIVRNKIDMLWVIGFRANGDHPFWYTFKDAPASMKERGEVISQMMERQRKIVIDVTGNPKTQFRTIFYDELSDLLSEGFIHPPADESFIWTYVAARRDHYPNVDIQQLDKGKNYNLGYYFNYQFTSTGSHLAAGEGPWKMEQNYRYVASKTSRPVAFSVVNAGNIREFVMEISANAAMMWDFKKYSTDSFLKEFCAMYYGKDNASLVSDLYKAYYNAYWQQRNPDLPNFSRQYIFQDLRYKKAIQEIAGQFDKPFTTSPLKDIGAEQLKGRTYRIIPADNGVTTDLDALIKGTTKSSQAFANVTQEADKIFSRIDSKAKTFFNDNLREPSHYMFYLNKSLLNLCRGYQAKDNAASRSEFLNESFGNLEKAQESLYQTQHGNFASWYSSDKIFGLKELSKSVGDLRSTTKAAVSED